MPQTLTWTDLEVVKIGLWWYVKYQNKYWNYAYRTRTTPDFIKGDLYTKWGNNEKEMVMDLRVNFVESTDFCISSDL